MPAEAGVLASIRRRRLNLLVRRRKSLRRNIPGVPALEILEAEAEARRKLRRRRMPLKDEKVARTMKMKTISLEPRTLKRVVKNRAAGRDPGLLLAAWRGKRKRRRTRKSQPRSRAKMKVARAGRGRGQQAADQPVLCQ